MPCLVRRAGFLSSVQDLGRPGHRASGVPLGGALDWHALRVANLIVGNEPTAAGLELTLGTMRLRFQDDRLVAWCGGKFEVMLGDRPLPPGRPALVRANEELVLMAQHGRAWLALSGGVEIAPVLGSRATDLRSGFGGLDGRLLRDGDELPLGLPTSRAHAIGEHLQMARIANCAAPNEWCRTTPTHSFLRIVRAADAGLFAAEAHDVLVLGAFTVLPDSDRMGLRLEGPPLHRTTEGDLLSEAVAPGTIQVPADGQPIVLLGDCQTIGGYPKIAHVITVDLAAAAQLQAGDTVRFVAVALHDAQRLLRQRERDLAVFGAALQLRTRWS